MDDTTLIEVGDFGPKLEVLLAYGASRAGKGYPTTRRRVAELLTEAGYKTDSAKITRVDTGERKFRVCEHKALLAQFGVAWPCSYYYDGGSGGDEDIEAFRDYLFRESRTIRLITAAGANRVAFANTRLFVFELRSADDVEPHYEGRIIAKPLRLTLMGSEGEWLGREIGHCSFAEFTVFVSVRPTMRVAIVRPPEFDSEHNTYEVIDQSTNHEPSWYVRALPTSEGEPTLDGNIDLVRLSVFRMDKTDEVRIVAKGPIPRFTPRIPPEVASNPVAARRLAAKFGKIAQNKVIDGYLNSIHPTEDGGQTVTIGDLSFRLKNYWTG